MTDEEKLAQMRQQQVDLGAQVINLFVSQSVRHEVQLSTLVLLLDFLTLQHPCCFERVSSALLDMGIRFAELVRKQEQESTQPRLH